MKLMVLDGNSILNRSYYGIHLGKRRTTLWLGGNQHRTVCSRFAITFLRPPPAEHLDAQHPVGIGHLLHPLDPLPVHQRIRHRIGHPNG